MTGDAAIQNLIVVKRNEREVLMTKINVIIEEPKLNQTGDPYTNHLFTQVMDGNARIAELEEALDNILMQGVENGGWMMVPKVEWDNVYRGIDLKSKTQD